MLTSRQRELLMFIRTFQKANGYSPSYREMAKGIGVSSTNGVSRLLDHMAERGFISKTGHNLARGIEILRDEHGRLASDMLGLKIAAGQAVPVMKRRFGQWETIR